MGLIPISAVDAVSPSIEWTRRLLLRPFRWSVWLRFAFLGLITGEMGGGGGFHFNVPSIPQFPPHRSGGEHFLPPNFPGGMMGLALAITVAVVMAIVLLLILGYLGSIFRFVLMESVVTGQVRIRAGFRRWQAEGTRFFLFQLAFSFIYFLAFAVLIGVPVLLAWAAGIFRHPGSHVALLILGGVSLAMVAIVLLLVVSVFFIFTKDLVVPIMALERVGAVEGWRRLWPMLQSDKGPYAAYVGMKIVLAIAAGIITGIVGLIVILVLMVPIAVVALLAFAGAHAAGIGWNPVTITLAVVAGSLVAAVIIFAMAMVGAPVAVFFQCYVLRFFAGRYQKLADWLYPPPEAPSAPAPA